MEISVSYLYFVLYILALIANAPNYLSKGTAEVQRRIANGLPYTIDIEVASGNGIGLSGALEFNYTIKLTADYIPGQRVVLVFGRTSVRVEDLDSNVMKFLHHSLLNSCDSGA